ncbi:MAG TPA: efflux transporter outer membrane subunit [Chthoniobacterales bacterium]|nr:efflux transporter outer membrane subunit [Chthoniobacterales bacterium]
MHNSLVSCPRKVNIFQQSLKLALGVILCLLTGCLVGPKYNTPVATLETLPPEYKESPIQFKDGAGWKVARPHDAMLRGPWWRIFRDPELNALEDQLNINDQNIKEFFQNFMEARALIAEANAQLYPTLTANASYTKSGAGTAPPISSILSVLQASWEPDLWGKFRNALRSAQYIAQFSAADLANEQLSEQASLAAFVFQIRGQDALEKVLNDTIVADQKALDYNRAQYETGITDQISVVEAENTLQNVQAAATNVGVARAQYEHAIAVLTGRVASNFAIPVRVLDSTPPPIPIGVPSQLVERRPDVAAAERTMASANAEIGIAYAAYFPTVTINGERGFQNSSIAELFNDRSRIWSIGPSISETVFDAGLRNATVHQDIAIYNADLAAYRQSVLTAFQQVEDGLAQVRIFSKQLIQQRAAEQSAQQFLKLEIARYQTGIDPYIDVVTAQNTLLTDQQAVVIVQVDAMTGAVALIKALGGGWDLSLLPSPHEVSKAPTREETAIRH